MAQRFDDDDRMGARALEMASGTDAVLKQHLLECRDRYLSVERALKNFDNRMMGGIAFVVVLLLSILGYMVSHAGIPLAH